ncbi:MAG: ABC transporter ATP-binding protein [Candidatus Flexifilum sp.]
MSNLALKVEGLGKQYRIGKQERYRTFRDTLVDVVTAPARRAIGLLRGNAAAAANLTETIWALRDVSFEVKHGEVVGIIGRNGAGKSTLLKILSRITEPTTGYADVYGRVGALLEVGTGFHPELTGRENIYLNGAILGMSREEIRRKFDEIVDFAGVEKFIDTPVKHYSSGMGLRLGFAVAAHLEPEILVVDEVLAVGDAEFQKKCMGKMSQVAGEGRTVLFVSHNMAAVQSLCTRGIWLNSGALVEDGRTEDIVSHYLSQAVQSTVDQFYPDIAQAPGNDRIRVRRMRVVPAEGDPGEPITMVTPIRLEFEYWNLQPTLLNLSLHVLTVEGLPVFSSVPVHEERWMTRPHPAGLIRTTCDIPGYLMNAATYSIRLLFVEDHARIIYQIDHALVFDVTESVETYGYGTWFGQWPGVVHPNLNWKIEVLEPILHPDIDGIL